MVVKSSRSGSGVKPEGVVEATVFTRSFRLKINEIIVHFTFTLSNLNRNLGTSLILFDKGYVIFLSR